MKKLLFTLFLLVCITTSISAQNAEFKEAIYSKVFNPAFSQDYKKEPVVIIGEFFSPKAWEPYIFPSKVRKYVMFQCVDIGSQTKSDPLSGENRGDLFCIDKENSDIIFTLKKGDKLKITGTTYTYTNFGINSVFFIATKIEKE